MRYVIIYPYKDSIINSFLDNKVALLVSSLSYERQWFVYFNDMVVDDLATEGDGIYLVLTEYRGHSTTRVISPTMKKKMKKENTKKRLINIVPGNGLVPSYT